MSLARFTEKPLSQEGSQNPPSRTYHYTAYPSVDAAEVEAAAYALTAPTVLTQWGLLYRQNISTEPEAADQWHVTVNYGPRERETGSFSLSFDTTGGTANTKVGLSTPHSYKATGETEEPPDQKSAIDVQEDGSVNGMDTIVPALKLSVHFKHPQGVITLPQIKAIARATGCVSDSPFLTFEPGEVLFLGATGSEGSDAETEVTYQLACSENLEDETIGPFTGVTKDGWDVAWIRFKPAVEGGLGLHVPRWLYVVRVYRRKNLAAILGFG